MDQTVTPLDLAHQIDAAHSAHLAWKRQFIIEINLGHRAMAPDDVSATGACGFGAWLGSDAIGDPDKRTEPYHLTRWLHGEVHAIAGEVVALARDGRKFEAEQLMNSQLVSVSNVLSHVLEEWKSELEGRGPARLFGS